MYLPYAFPTAAAIPRSPFGFRIFTIPVYLPLTCPGPAPTTPSPVHEKVYARAYDHWLPALLRLACHFALRSPRLPAYAYTGNLCQLPAVRFFCRFKRGALFKFIPCATTFTNMITAVLHACLPAPVTALRGYLIGPFITPTLFPRSVARRTRCCSTLPCLWNDLWRWDGFLGERSAHLGAYRCILHSAITPALPFLPLVPLCLLLPYCPGAPSGRYRVDCCWGWTTALTFYLPAVPACRLERTVQDLPYPPADNLGFAPRRHFGFGRFLRVRVRSLPIGRRFLFCSSFSVLHSHLSLILWFPFPSLFYSYSILIILIFVVL